MGLWPNRKICKLTSNCILTRLPQQIKHDKRLWKTADNIIDNTLRWNYHYYLWKHGLGSTYHGRSIWQYLKSSWNMIIWKSTCSVHKNQVTISRRKKQRGRNMTLRPSESHYTRHLCFLTPSRCLDISSHIRPPVLCPEGEGNERKGTWVTLMKQNKNVGTSPQVQRKKEAVKYFVCTRT